MSLNWLKIFVLYVFETIFINRLVGLVGRVFANGPRDQSSISGRVLPYSLKNGTW